MTVMTSSISSGSPLLCGREEAIVFDPAPGRVALIAPAGLFRDSFAHAVARFLEELRLECYDDVDDVPHGPARLALIAFDPHTCDRVALRSKIGALSALCDGAPVGVVTPDEHSSATSGLGALGVAGVVSLSGGAAVAFAAIRLMSIGGYCLPPEPSTAVEWISAPGEFVSNPQSFDASRIRRSANDASKLARSELTPRERDVLRSLREGHQNKNIAFQLGISESTVKVHLRNIMRKLNASNRTQVALDASPAA